MNFPRAFFRFRHPFLSKMHSTKTQTFESELFYDGRNFGDVIDTKWGRIYILPCEHFGLSVHDLYSITSNQIYGFFRLPD